MSERVNETGDPVMGEGRTAANPPALLHGPLGSVHLSSKPRQVNRTTPAPAHASLIEHLNHSLRDRGTAPQRKGSGPPPASGVHRLVKETQVRSREEGHVEGPS